MMDSINRNAGMYLIKMVCNKVQCQIDHARLYNSENMYVCM